MTAPTLENIREGHKECEELDCDEAVLLAELETEHG